MATPDFLDRLTGFVQGALASIQENIQLRAENAKLKAANAELSLKIEVITSSFDEDEKQKADTATKLASLEQLLTEYESISVPVAVAA
ncbi:hypothetical protein [Nostoc sp.]|uniref:hypothetical protein n=1 Tax=Nostoc sp. TaxID=1180 RepID=UPI002FF78D5F